MEERRKILLADDVELFLELEKSFLKRADIDLLVARDGQQALDLTRLHHPNVVFLDLYMPALEGDACCQAIKGYPELSDVKVIMVTTAGKPEEMQRCRDAGCDEILLKPINRSEFMSLARKYLQIEVRSDARIKAEVRVFYGPSPQKILEDFSVDLSTGGLFVRTTKPLEADEQMTLRFTLPDKSGNVSCQARVAWVNDPERPRKPALPSGMGIQFIDMSLDDMHAIRRFLEHNDLEPSW